jgi:hypothetical protein
MELAPLLMGLSGEREPIESLEGFVGEGEVETTIGGEKKKQ